MENWINLRQERDFGEKFNATFTFIRQNYKNLLIMLSLMGLPVMLLNGIISLSYSNSLREMMVNKDTQFLFLYFFVMILLILVSYSWLNLIVYTFIHNYSQNIPFTLESIFKHSIKKFLAILATNFFSFLFIILGYVISVIIISFIFSVFIKSIIGIILFVLTLIFIFLLFFTFFSMVNPVLIFDQLSVWESFSRGFLLLKDKFFKTFGYITVSILIIFIMLLVFSLPLMIYNQEMKYSVVNEVTIGYIIASLLSQIGITYIYPVFYIILSFQYFNLVEGHESTGLKLEIDSLIERQSSENKGNEGEY